MSWPSCGILVSDSPGRVSFFAAAVPGLGVLLRDEIGEHGLGRGDREADRPGQATVPGSDRAFGLLTSNQAPRGQGQGAQPDSARAEDRVADGPRNCDDPPLATARPPLTPPARQPD